MMHTWKALAVLVDQPARFRLPLWLREQSLRRHRRSRGLQSTPSHARKNGKPTDTNHHKFVVKYKTTRCVPHIIWVRACSQSPLRRQRANAILPDLQAMHTITGLLDWQVNSRVMTALTCTRWQLHGSVRTRKNTHISKPKTSETILYDREESSSATMTSPY